MLDKSELLKLEAMYESMLFNPELMIQYCGARNISLRDAFDAIHTSILDVRDELDQIRREELQKRKIESPAG